MKNNILISSLLCMFILFSAFNSLAGGGDDVMEFHGHGSCKDLVDEDTVKIIVKYDGSTFIYNIFDRYESLPSTKLINPDEWGDLDVFLWVTNKRAFEQEKKSWKKHLSNGTHTFTVEPVTLKFVRDGWRVDMYCQ